MEHASGSLRVAAHDGARRDARRASFQLLMPAQKIPDLLTVFGSASVARLCALAPHSALWISAPRHALRLRLLSR
eukprot:1875678-Prymnesium_polylepis.1